MTRLVWICLMVGLVSRTTFGGPPLRTDDPGTAGLNKWEMNLGHTLFKTDAALRMEVPSVEVNYGLHENDELTLAAPVVGVDPKFDESHWGVGDLQLAYKVRFIDERDADIGVSVAPKLFAPTGTQDFGIGFGQTQLFLPMEMGKHFFDEKLWLYGEVGYQFGLEDTRSQLLFSGVAGEWQVIDNTALLAEVGVVIAKNAGNDVFFNAGVQHRLAENVSFIGSAGRSFLDGGSRPAFMGFFGLQITWGGDAGNCKSRNS
jgi:hypothetical protein